MQFTLPLILLVFKMLHLTLATPFHYLRNSALSSTLSESFNIQLNLSLPIGIGFNSSQLGGRFGM
jgi:hypothetical protein